MSSTSQSKPVSKQSRPSKAAIIRPVSRRDGKTSFVRIDAAEETATPKARALQLEDYVAQFKRSTTQTDRPAAPPAKPPAKRKKARPTRARKKQNQIKVKVQPKTTVATKTAKQQKVSSAELTQADHVDVLQAVAKLDAGYQWIAQSNRSAATEAADFAESLEQTTIESVEVQSTTQPVSQALVNDIAAAIASVLTNVSESELSEKIEKGVPTVARKKTVPKPHVVVAPSVAQEENLKLSPEIPRPEYTLPVTEHSFVAKKKSKPASKQIPKATKTVSLSAAAWDVPEFRWPTVTDQIMAVQSSLGELSENCKNILSPFGKTIAVTAPTRGQGTTTMSITLARLFAESGKRVLLIDADIMQPELSKTVGLSGVSWYRNSCSDESIGECIVHGKKSGVCVMPLDGPISNVSAHSDPIFDQLDANIDRIRGEFELIVIDAGPVWQIVDEISHDSHLVDVAMLVNQDTYSNGFSEARQRLMDRGVFKFIAAQNSHACKAG